MEQLINGLERMVSDVEMANGVLGEVVQGEEKNLGREAREMDEEIRGAGTGAGAGRGAKL